MRHAPRVGVRRIMRRMSPAVIVRFDHSVSPRVGVRFSTNCHPERSRASDEVEPEGQPSDNEVGISVRRA